MSITQALQSAYAQAQFEAGRVHPRHRVDQILGGHLLPILRREQWQARSVGVPLPLFRAEQAPQSLLLESVTKDTPRDLALVARQWRGRGFGAVGVAEGLPVSEPLRLFALVG